MAHASNSNVAMPEPVHVVLTRFNLATIGREQAFRNAPGWLEGRFDLFEKYCLPTMAAQTCKNFTWLVLFDQATPDWARERIARCQQVCAFTALFCGLIDNAGWARLVRDVIGDPVPGRLVVTSNLDNDDGLAVDYLARVQDCAARAWQGQTIAINLSHGLVLANRRLYLHDHRCCAFTNMVEADTPEIRTTKAMRHMDLPRLLPLVQIGGAPGWLQVVHGTNVSNKVRGKVIDRPGAEAFVPSVLAEVENPGWFEKRLDNGVLAPLRGWRDRVYVLIRRVFPADPASLQ